MNPTDPCLMQLLVEAIATLRPSKELAASFEAILTTPDNCGKEVGPALQWARSSKAFAHLLPEKNGHLIQQLSVPLLMWGLRQPWADTVSASHVVNFWFKYQARTAPIEDLAMDLAWATRAVRLVALDPLALRSRAEDLCRDWSYMCDKNSDLWKWSSVSPPRLGQVYDAWVDMGLLALPDLRDLERPAQTLDTTWLTRLSSVFKSMPDANQAGFMLALLASDTPAAKKKAACRKASTNSWLDRDVHAKLRPLMPAADHACFSELPWTEWKFHLKKDDVARGNEAIASLYCPTLSPGFSIMLSADDWCDRKAVCQVALMARSRPNPPLELLIGDLVI